VDRPPVVVIVGRQRAHEVLLLAMSVIIGVAYIIGGPPPRSLAALLHPAVFKGWAVLMLITGAAGLVGCLYRGRVETALGIERGAMTAQFGALLIYATVLFAYAGMSALLAGLITAGWAAADLARAVQISRDLRRLRP